MDLRVGLRAGDLLNLSHRSVTVTAGSGVIVRAQGSQGVRSAGPVRLRAENSCLILEMGGKRQSLGDSVTVRPIKSESLKLDSAAFSRVPRKTGTYFGELEVRALGNDVRLVLRCDLEKYVRGVLQSEVPASYHLEAMKAQAVLARTYGLRPRIPHQQLDSFNVCDSYLCCQAFYGVKTLTGEQSLAIDSTRGQILSYQGQPALALFSACAGGHTEDYENCFSDPVTGAFPPPVLPYLKGVPEGELAVDPHEESGLRKLYAMNNPPTADGWAPQFRWTVRLTADAIESHMHHVISEMLKDPQQRPFIQAPPSKKFGHVNGFEVLSRGVAGTAIRLNILTSEGPWQFTKELVIRNAFANPTVQLKRLRSARLFFDVEKDNLGLISAVRISGLGSGHGVGLQQTGAQGWAKKGLKYDAIIKHYYPGAGLTRV